MLNLEAVVLAAGAGSRYGGGKLLAPWRGGVLLDGALAAACAAPVRCVRVVWGADPAVNVAVQAYAARAGEGPRLVLVRAKDHAQGLSASLAAGLQAVPADADAVFIFLGDMPRIPQLVIAPLIEAVAAGAVAAAPTFGGERGHPVLIRTSLAPALRRLSGDRGAGAYLHTLGAGLALVPTTDDGVSFDVDRPEDLL